MPKITEPNYRGRQQEKSSASKGPWTKEEDRKVIALVQQHGPKRWSQIASELPGECLLFSCVFCVY